MEQVEQDLNGITSHGHKLLEYKWLEKQNSLQVVCPACYLLVGYLSCGATSRGRLRQHKSPCDSGALFLYSIKNRWAIFSGKGQRVISLKFET
jgi:hypothetical protein